MTQYLPPNLLALFAPRDPLPYLAPLDTLPCDKKPWPYSGISQYLNLFEDPNETPPATRGETKEERLLRKRNEREERHRESVEHKVSDWDPNNDANIDGDPFKTLFVGRINFDTSESKLRREFEQYGPIRRIHMVTNQKSEKPCGYAFIMYEKERDMHAAYKHADGKKIDSKRVVVDVERGRTVKSWKPRRLGGGLGGTRRGAPHENIKYSGRVDERDMDHNEREREKDRGDQDREGDRELERDRGREREPDGERDRGREREPDGERDRDRDREKRYERSQDKERDRGRGGGRDRGDRDRKRRSRERERKRGSPNRERNRDRAEREQDSNRKDRSRSRDQKDKREKEKSRDRDKERERGKDKEEKKERGRDRNREKDRSSRREKDKDKEREKEREKDHGVKRRDTEESMNGGPPIET